MTFAKTFIATFLGVAIALIGWHALQRWQTEEEIRHLFDSPSQVIPVNPPAREAVESEPQAEPANTETVGEIQARKREARERSQNLQVEYQEKCEYEFPAMGQGYHRCMYY